MASRRPKVKLVSHLNLSEQLLEAVQQGKAKIVKRLLDSRVDTNCVTEENETPLLLATSLKDREARKTISNLLLDRGCQINTCDRNGQTPLMSAIKVEDHELVSTLLDKGSDVGMVDHEGNTPLCLAAKTGNPDIVQKILVYSLKNKICVDHKNMRGLTPLLIASQNGHLKAAKILVERGNASVTIRDLENFMTPHDWMQETSFYNSTEFSFLSPKMKCKRNRKAVKTMAHYMNEIEDISGTESPSTFEFDSTSASKLPHLVGGTNESRSMFDVASVSQSTSKTVPAFSFGKVVPLKMTHLKAATSDKLPLLSSTSTLNYHPIHTSKKRLSNKRSAFYSKGSLEPLLPPGKSLLTRQDSITGKKEHTIKQNEPFPMLKDNYKRQL